MLLCRVPSAGWVSGAYTVGCLYFVGGEEARNQTRAKRSSNLMSRDETAQRTVTNHLNLLNDRKKICRKKEEKGRREFVLSTFKLNTSNLSLAIRPGNRGREEKLLGDNGRPSG